MHFWVLIELAYFTKETPMDQEAKARIESAEAKKSGGNIQTGSFGARAQVD